MGDKSVGATDVYFVANAYYIYVTELVAKTAHVLGKYGEAAYYEVLREKTLRLFQERILHRKRQDRQRDSDCMRAVSLFNLAYEKDRENIVQMLVSNIEDHQNHLTTGFVGTPYLCHALSENKAHDTAGLLFHERGSAIMAVCCEVGARRRFGRRWDGSA